MRRSSDSVGVGIVGAGLIGHKRAGALPSGFHVAAVTDLQVSLSRALADKHAGCASVDSAEALVLRDDVDLVVVATTHDQLAPIGCSAVEHGKHVLIEKPAGIGVESLFIVSRSAEEHGLIGRVGYNHRFHPSMLKARDLLRSGQYGSLLWIRARYGHGGRVGYEQEWRADAKRSGGGELIDQGSHLIDLVRFFAGEVTLAFAELPTLFWKMAVEDNAFLALRPNSGGFAWLHASWSEWKNLFSLEITLESAKIELNGLGGSYGSERLTLFEMSPQMGPPFSTSWEWPAGDNSWLAEMSDIQSQMQGGDYIGASLDDGVAVLRVIEQAYAFQ